MIHLMGLATYSQSEVKMAKRKIVSSNQTAMGFIEDIVKSNETLISEIDNSPSLKKKFDTDTVTMGQLLASQRGVQEVMAMLFEQEMVGVREDDKYKWIDPRNGRIPQHYLRRAGETEIPRVIKNLRRLQLTEFSETASSKKYGREMGFALAWKNPNYKATKEEKERQIGRAHV